MFKIDRSPAYWWPVKVGVAMAGDEAGRVEEAEFDVEFRRLGDAQVREISEQLAQAVVESGGKRGGNADFAHRVVINFRKVELDGASLPWSVQAFDELLNVPGVAQSIIDAFFQSRSPAAAKN